MSHVISAQPSSTSPYQPTEIQEKGDGYNPPRSMTIETREGREDCCFRADKSQGCFIYYCCNFLSSICGAIRDCTEKCCNCCADCLNDCCEDKPQVNRKRRRRGSIDADFNDDDNTWVVGAIHHHNTVIDDRPTVVDSKTESISRFSKSNNEKHTSDRHGSPHNSIDMAYHSDNQIIFGDGPYHDASYHQDDKSSAYEPNDSDNHKSGWSKAACTSINHFTGDNSSKSRHANAHHSSTQTNTHHSSTHHTNIHHSGSDHPNENYSSTHHTNTHHSGSHHPNDNYSSSHHTNDNYSGNHTNDNHTSHESGGHHTSSHDTGGNYDSGTCDTGGWDSGGGDTGGGDGGGCD